MEPARKFRVIVNSKECGTCSGATPSAVAKKVVKKLCGNSSKMVRFSLKECKRGSERVCGPYQGRMEKLDKPYTRAGKKITHRVVCGKVRKMRGGDLRINEYLYPIYVKKKNDSPIFDMRVIRLGDTTITDVYLFLGEIIINDTEYYKYILTIDMAGELRILTTNEIVNNQNKELIDYTVQFFNIDNLKNTIQRLPEDLISEIKRLTDNDIFDCNIRFANNIRKYSRTSKNSMRSEKLHRLLDSVRKQRIINQ